MNNKKINKRMKIMIKNINVLYRYFIMKDFESINDTIKSFNNINKIEIKLIFNNIDQIITDIKKYINKNWTFERLNNLHKAILVNGVYEISYKKTDKNLVINELLEIIKLFDIDNNYKYINAILDNFFN